MDRVTFSSLASNIVVIGIDGEIRTLEPGQVPASGELVITEVSDTSQLNFEQIAPDGSSINVTDDITALIEAIAAGEDPAQLEGDFEPAAGESDGSSPQSTGAIDRTGAEYLLVRISKRSVQQYPYQKLKSYRCLSLSTNK